MRITWWAHISLIEIGTAQTEERESETARDLMLYNLTYPPRGDAHVAGSALYAIVSDLSANSKSPRIENIVLYENIASTTPHVSIPREGERVGGVGSSSSPLNMPVGRP